MPFESPKRSSNKGMTHDYDPHPRSLRPGCTPRIKPGTYGPLPMPRKPLYEHGEITGWLHLQGYKVHSRWGVQTVFVSRNAAELLRLRFYRGT